MLDKVQIRVAKPLFGDELLAENELRRRREAADEELARLRGELAGLADESDRGELEERIAVLGADRALVQQELDERYRARLVTVDVQTASFGGRIRQMEAAGQVEEWREEQRRHNLAEDAPPGAKPTAEELAAVALTDQQREDYVVMLTCAVLVGAVCRDEKGRPVCSNFDWPADMHGWTQVPSYLVEPLLMQVYALNPSWAPDWLTTPGDEAQKN